MTQFKIIILYPLFCLTAGLWSSCRTSSGTDVHMPPSPPHDRMQSEIFPDARQTESIQAPVKEMPKIPKGISLVFDGQEMTLESLEKISAQPQTRPVTVRAHPSTPYSEVEDTMDQLHAMGFLITFEAKE